MSYVVSLIKIVLMVNIVLGDENCPYKECSCDGTTIECGYRSLKSMPQKLFNKSLSLATLLLDENQITTIPAGSLPANLSVLSLSSNPINTIDDTAFDESIYTLQELTFSEVQFTQIPEAVFHLKVLKSLQIYDTNSLAWNEDIRNNFGSTVQTLTFIDVGITAWPTWMKSMTNLTEVTISGCSISTIPDDALDMIANSLMSIDFSNIGLTKLPKSLSNLTVLRKLTLNNNKLTELTWLPHLSPLDTLYLEHNKVTDAQKLSNLLRPYANTLIQFDVQHNSLTSIPDFSFLTQIVVFTYEFNHISDANSGSFPSNLTGLYIDNNLLVSIPSVVKNLNSMVYLSITSNNIKTVEGSHIPSSVKDLDLSFNSISQLTRSSFPQNSSLNTLTLNNNPLSTISPDAFTNIPLLLQLSVQSTKLTRLPLALASLTKLYYLDLFDSKSLVCTCQEQSLLPWINSLASYSIIGECGLTDINYFFQVLSPECPQTS